MAGKFELKILSPSRTLLSVKAHSLIVPGSQGYMTILPNHAAMVAEIGVGELVIQATGIAAAERYFVSGGYIDVDHNKILVLADIVEKANEIDLTRAQEALKRAQAHLSRISEETDLERASQAQKRAEVRVFVAQTLASVAKS